MLFDALGFRLRLIWFVACVVKAVVIAYGLFIRSIGSLVKKGFPQFPMEVIFRRIRRSELLRSASTFNSDSRGVFFHVDQIFHDVFDVEFGIKLEGDHFGIVRTKGNDLAGSPDFL